MRIILYGTRSKGLFDETEEVVHILDDDGSPDGRCIAIVASTVSDEQLYAVARALGAEEIKDDRS